MVKKKRRGGARDESVVYINYTRRQLERLFDGLRRSAPAPDREPTDEQLISAAAGLPLWQAKYAIHN